MSREMNLSGMVLAGVDSVLSTLREIGKIFGGLAILLLPGPAILLAVAAPLAGIYQLWLNPFVSHRLLLICLVLICVVAYCVIRRLARDAAEVE